MQKRNSIASEINACFRANIPKTEKDILKGIDFYRLLKEHIGDRDSNKNEDPSNSPFQVS